MTDSKRYDWVDNFKLNIWCLNWMGLWPKSNANYSLNLYTVYSSFVIFSLAITYMISLILNVYFARDNLEDLIAITYVGLIGMVAECKIYYVIKNIQVFKANMKTLESDWFQPKTVEEKLLIEPSIKLWRNVYKFLLVMCFASNAFWMSYPFLDSSIEEKRLPFVGWYPYDTKKSPYYELTYAFQIVSTMYLTLVHINVDTTINGFNVYIGCQFDILCYNLASLGNESDSSETNGNLKDCILHHKNILKFIENCLKFHKWIIAWHLILSGVSIGITLFQLTLVAPFSSEFYSLMSYESAIILEIFMYCWFGNDVKAKSSLVSYAAFQSAWIDQSQEVRKNLLFFMINVEQPASMSAFNVFHLSLDTFMTILKTAWSYFALLHQVTSNH